MNLIARQKIINFYNMWILYETTQIFFYNVLFYKFIKLLVQHGGPKFRLIKKNLIEVLN